ncbi:hypothetical protein JCM11491_004311 [Sporobolomyces phaffii]
MDSPYSPLAAPSRSPTLGHAQHADSHSPPLVPIPAPPPPGHDSPYDPNYHHRPPSPSRGDPYRRDPAPYRDSYAHHHPHPHARYSDDWHSHSHHRPYPEWAPPHHHHDPYYRPPPPPPSSRDHPYAYAPRDPYPPAYPPRDPYAPYSAYHDPYYDTSRASSWHHHHHHPHPHHPGPPPPSAPAYPPPPPSAATAVPPPPPPLVASPTTGGVVADAVVPLASTAVSLGPHPVHGHLDPQSDLSVPILYLARPISTKTFAPLRLRFPHLELRFVNSLLELDRDLKRVHLDDLDRLHRHAQAQAQSQSQSQSQSRRVGGGAEEEGEEEEGGAAEEEPGNNSNDVAAAAAPAPPKRTQRRVWITAVGGTDALVQRIWHATPDKIEWKEIVDLNHLDRELAFEDHRVVELLHEQADAADVAGDRDRDREEWDEHERGRREIEQREAEGTSRRGGGEGQVEELDRVLRAVRGEKDRSQSREVVDDHHRDEAGTPRGPEEEPKRLGTSRNGERGEAVVTRFEDMAERDYVARPPYPDGARAASGSTEEGFRRGEDGGSHSRKRTRHDAEEEPDHSASRAARKKLEAICKAPRRNCVAWARANDVAVNDETRLIDEEPVLGERHRGVWNLLGHELDDISPQIQVLMARAMRDVTYPPRLQLYSTPDALEQLEETVPWFTTILKTIGDRYELAGAASVAPQDPPISDDPLEPRDSDASDAADGQVVGA